MKATGIVRRIDELGRVVIPKEIRRTLRIKEGDPLEIFTERDELTLKKYSPIATLEKFSEGATKSLGELSGTLALICDTDEILYAFGENKKEFVKKPLSDKLDKILKDRRSYIANLSESGEIVPLSSQSEIKITSQIITPIVLGGDLLGGVILCEFEDGSKMDTTKIKLCQLTASILSSQFD